MINKAPPAFQFYASDTMADKKYRMMSLSERGLYISILCECWVNDSVPSDPVSLAKYLGFHSLEIERSLTTNLLGFFKNGNDELSSPSLDNYKKDLNQRREAQSKGGKKGAESTWGGSKNKAVRPNGQDTVNNMATPIAPRVETNGVEEKRKELVETENTHKKWLNEYEKESKGE